MPSLVPMMLAAPTEAVPQSATAVMMRFLAVKTDAWPTLYNDLKEQGVDVRILDEGNRRAAAVRSVSGSPWFTLHKVLATASAFASGYHGVKRHRGSIGWGLWWFAMGGLFPVITPAFAAFQGFAKEK